jgi:hypothetical protein
LCDVNIETPALVRYLPTQVWHSNIIARAMSYDEQTASYSQTADFLEALGKAYDATRHLVGADVVFLPGRIDAIRAEVGKLLSEGESIIDLPEMIGESFARILAALTRGVPNPIWMWGDLEWLQLEDILHSANQHSAYALADQMGLSRNQWQMTTYLINLYGKSTTAAATAASKATIDEIIEKYHNLPFKSLMTMVRASGLDYADNTVKSYRRRYRKSISAPLLARGKSGNVSCAALTLVLGDVLSNCPI